MLLEILNLNNMIVYAGCQRTDYIDKFRNRFLQREDEESILEYVDGRNKEGYK